MMVNVGLGDELKACFPYY